MRASQLFMPLKKVKTLDTVELLVNHGFIRQSTAGVFNLLPLGLRVQQKIESIIRKRLNDINCQETSLATLASTDLWKQSGRITGKDLFLVDQTRDADSSQRSSSSSSLPKYLLAPTAEEEITSMVAKEVTSYRQLPLKLYQIGKKYRNEKRPRGALLRGREFVMKDLYTFDVSEKAALDTYYTVQEAYNSIFQDIGTPFVVAEADTGSIGGSLSHEYHYISDAGEDTVVKCNSCSYTANLERAEYSSPVSASSESSSESPSKASTTITTKVEYFLSEDRDTLVAAYYPSNRKINTYLVNSEMPVVECEDPVELFRKSMETDSLSCRLLRLIDPLSDGTELPEPDETLGISKRTTTTLIAPITYAEVHDSCPACNEPESLEFERAIEVGHTFYLGKKYSSVFNANVQTSDGNSATIEMGCYGIGVSRLISAIADATKDSEGLCWPPAVSPFDAMVIASDEAAGLSVTSHLKDHGIEALWDDRSSQFGLLLGNSKSIGFPYVIVAGKHYQNTGELEVQPRSGAESTCVKLEGLAGVLKSFN